MTSLETPRLRLRQLVTEDAPFILELLNEPGWLRFIGDRGVHDLQAARSYIEKGPQAMYARLGFGLYCVETRDGMPLGMCGLLKRDSLEYVDLGFALLARHQGRGYAREAAAASLAQARALGMEHVAAITNPDNARSISLLESLGFKPEGRRQLTPDAPEVCLFLWQAVPST
ncbi:MAG TPA: GNAT family N-acetyltransferase [Gammaproteobacteria bacterium]|nr:GNAT family N-acetyltransferase [Gammaproteobacteria bacterium]